MKLVIMMMIGLVPSILMGRIGDNQEQCEARYGASVSATSFGGQAKHYRVGALEITCSFKGGKCFSAIYSLIRPSIVVGGINGGIESDIDERQAMQLLLLSSSGAKWKRVSGDAFEELYATEGGDLQAAVSKSGVRIESVNEYRKDKALTASAEIAAAINKVCK